MTFIQDMHRSLKTAEGRPLLVEVQGSRLVETTGRELEGLVARVRGFLAAAGVKAGDRVGLIAHNSAKWAAADLGMLGAGAIVVPMYDRQAPAELRGMLENCETELVVVENDKLKGELLSGWDKPPRVATFDEVFAAAPADTTPVDVKGGDRVTMIYTSGTSGEPKGVLYTADNVDFMLARTTARLREMVGDRTGQDRVFHYLPLCFAGSRIQLWSQLARANPLMVSTDLNNLVEELKTAAPHYFLNVPTLLERIKVGVGNKLKERGGIAYALYKAAVDGDERVMKGTATLLHKLAIAVGRRVVFPKIKEQVGVNLEFLICGSAPLSEETQRWFGLVGVPVYQVYGLTETTAICTMDRKGLARPGYVGRAIEGVELKLTDEGELIARGANIFPEYWKRPDATQKSLQNGWFHSGDLAEISPQGDVKIVGRLKDLLVPESGHNVAPGPIEEKLAAKLPGVQVMVVGHARPYLSAIFAGSVERSEVERAIEAINSDLPHYRRIRKFHVTKEPFSVENGLLTANQKLKRAAVEKHHARSIEEMYA
jgi:long-chain acyl-CoA synthetase